VNGARHQLLAGSAFPADQDGGTRGRDLAHELEDLAHARAAAHHVVLNIDGLLKPAVLRFQPFQAARIFKRRAQDAADGGRQLEVRIVECGSRTIRLQVDHAEYRILAPDGRGQHAAG
jgi:hypothetical protein